MSRLFEAIKLDGETVAARVLRLPKGFETSDYWRRCVAESVTFRIVEERSGRWRLEEISPLGGELPAVRPPGGEPKP